MRTDRWLVGTVLLLMGLLAFAGENPKLTDPADPNMPAAPVTYHSAFSDYQTTHFGKNAPGNWRAANDEVANSSSSMQGMNHGSMPMMSGPAQPMPDMKQMQGMDHAPTSISKEKPKQSDHMAMKQAPSEPPSNGQPSAHLNAEAMSEGQVIKIDKTDGKITIRHGPLRNLGMPGMTMVFKVQSPAMLEQINAGDKVRFVAEKMAGSLTVTALRRAH